MTGETNQAIEAVWKQESGRVIASLVRMVRDVGLAEELAHDALVAALEQWPNEGIPRNPGAWLTATAKHRALDQLRRGKLRDRKYEEVGRDLEFRQNEAAETALIEKLDDDVGDDLLRLIFTACHPALSADGRIALTLRLLGGLSTPEIARAFLVPEPTVAQRIVRAKKTLADQKIPFEVPRGDELAERLASVLSVVYLIFNEGYSATSGGDWMRPALCREAMRLGKIVVELMPDEPEVRSLVALMELQASRLRARVNAAGDPILLPDQDRTQWDAALIRSGLAGLNEAKRIGGERGLYTLQASIAACHARAARAEDTDWKEIARLYGELANLTGSPVVELNRAVAVSMAEGPAAGLEVVDRLRSEPILENYHRLPSVRGDFLFKLERKAEARSEFERAAAMTQNVRERDLLLERAHDCE